LEQRGLVERSSDEHDRRVRIVQLTPAGRKLIECAFAKHAGAMEAAAAGLSHEERGQLIRLLRKLGKTAKAAS
jgi:DNA-binding MarR family transcriptional regulator